MSFLDNEEQLQETIDAAIEQAKAVCNSERFEGIIQNRIKEILLSLGVTPPKALRGNAHEVIGDIVVVYANTGGKFIVDRRYWELVGLFTWRIELEKEYVSTHINNSGWLICCFWLPSHKQSLCRNK